MNTKLRNQLTRRRFIRNTAAGSAACTWLSAAWLMLVGGLSFGWSAELPVGPGRQYSRIEHALTAARPGDTILVHPQPNNQPYDQVALNVTRPRITLRSAAPRGTFVPLSGRGFDYSGRDSTPRAIVQFNKGADDCVIEGFELFGAHNDSHNGAGIRVNQANRVIVRRCVIRNNDMGIMSNGDGTPQSGVDQLIERCLIHSNGDLSEPGQNHNLYLGGTSVTLLGCEIHSSLAGQNVKSRAHRTAVLACYVHDSANREFDLVDAKGDTTVPGSDAVLAGNIIVKAKNCANRGVIHFGQDGGNEHDGAIHLIHNTIVTPFIGAVVDLSADKAGARLFNNILWDGGAVQRGQVLVSGKNRAEAGRVAGFCNWLAAGFASQELESLGLSGTVVATGNPALPFVNPTQGDYRLATRAKGIVDSGRVLPREIETALGRRLVEYQAGPGWRQRPDDGKPDLGAHELVAPAER
ncbi:MAG: hypothetical protein L0Z50_32945 [Verrucomicrobiales bacterium]|nr:hypothetical protein [Verrucomicrobiales bacterium]